MIRHPNGFEIFNWNYFQVACIQVGRVTVYQAGYLGVFGQDGPLSLALSLLNK